MRLGRGGRAGAAKSWVEEGSMGVLECWVGEEEGEEWTSSALWIVERRGGGWRWEVWRLRLGVWVSGTLSVARIFLW